MAKILIENIQRILEMKGFNLAYIETINDIYDDVMIRVKSPEDHPKHFL